MLSQNRKQACIIESKLLRYKNVEVQTLAQDFEKVAIFSSCINLFCEVIEFLRPCFEPFLPTVFLVQR